MTWVYSCERLTCRATYMFRRINISVHYRLDKHLAFAIVIAIFCTEVIRNNLYGLKASVAFFRVLHFAEPFNGPEAVKLDPVIISLYHFATTAAIFFFVADSPISTSHISWVVLFWQIAAMVCLRRCFPPLIHTKHLAGAVLTTHFRTEVIRSNFWILVHLIEATPALAWFAKIHAGLITLKLKSSL